jgi:hypothetical protein
MDFDGITHALYGRGWCDYVPFLATVVEEHLHHVHSPQFLVRGKPEVVTLDEVNRKCGPIYGPLFLLSVGPRPAGWGRLAQENRILSWMDRSLGLVGDQLVDIHERFVTSKPLDAFSDCLITGPLEGLKITPVPDEWQVPWWRGRSLEETGFDTTVLRDIFSEAMEARNHLEWSLDFPGHSLRMEALRWMVQDTMAIAHPEAMLARAFVTNNKKEATRAARLDPSLKPWSDWIKAWIDFPKGKPAWARLEKVDPLGPTLSHLLQAVLDALNGGETHLQIVEDIQPTRNNRESPYLSYILEQATDIYLEQYLRQRDEAGVEIGTADKVRLVQLGCRFPAIISWLLDEIRTGSSQVLNACLLAGFSPHGRFAAENYLNLLATAVSHGNHAAIRSFLSHGANPRDPSHYIHTPLQLLEDSLEEGHPWPDDIVAAMRNHLPHKPRKRSRE